MTWPSSDHNADGLAAVHRAAAADGNDHITVVFTVHRRDEFTQKSQVWAHWKACSYYFGRMRSTLTDPWAIAIRPKSHVQDQYSRYMNPRGPDVGYNSTKNRINVTWQSPAFSP